jgi:hypothetical protein
MSICHDRFRNVSGARYDEFLNDPKAGVSPHAKLGVPTHSSLLGASGTLGFIERCSTEALESEKASRSFDKLQSLQR